MLAGRIPYSLRLKALTAMNVEGRYISVTTVMTRTVVESRTMNAVCRFATYASWKERVSVICAAILDARACSDQAAWP